MTIELVEIDIPGEFIDLCNGWAGESDCRLRAIDSTGGLTIGNRHRWNNDVNRFLTDQEQHLSLWCDLQCDIRYCLRLMSKNGNHHPDFDAMSRFETFAEETEASLRETYGLQDSEAV